MSIGLISAAYVVAAILFILALGGLSNQEKAKRAIWYGIIGMALAVGATVGMCALVAGPLCGASMNPARSLGPALIAGQLGGLWIYLTAPVVGTALAVGGCRAIREPGCCSRVEEPGESPGAG